MLNYYDIKYVLDYHSITFQTESSCIGKSEIWTVGNEVRSVWVDLEHETIQPINMYNFILVLFGFEGLWTGNYE